VTQANTAGQRGWLLDNLVGRVQHVRQALVLSRDGLVVAASQNVSREDGDHLSALAAGVQSLARGAGRQFAGGEVRQTIIEMESAFLFIMAAGEGTCLAVLSSADANVGVMAYEMAMLVRRMGKHLAAPPRLHDHEAAAGGSGMSARRDRGLAGGAGPVVRPYLVPRGRTVPAAGRGIGLIDVVVAVTGAQPAGLRLGPEHRQLLARCRRPVTVVDLASDVDLAGGVGQGLRGGLGEDGVVRVLA